MKERILASLEGKAQIIEQISIPEEGIWGISFRMASGTCGHAILKGDKLIAKASYYSAKGPEPLADTLGTTRRAGLL